MATKKTNSKSTKKSAPKNEEQPVQEIKETKNAEKMSVDEITKMFVQNDTQSIERLKKENAPEHESSENKDIKLEKENEFEKIAKEVVSEQSKEKPNTDSKKETIEPNIEKIKPEQPKPTQTLQQPNTNRTVYGYDHFGIIYGY